MTDITKTSNFTGFDSQQDVETYITNVDKDLRTLFDYLTRLPKTYSQADEPTLATGDWAFWKDTDDSKFYLLKNIDGTQKKVELT